MPYYLKETNNQEELKQHKSVLITPCGFCPAASFAVRYQKPYFSFLRNFLRTRALDSHIKNIKKDLRKSGIKVKSYTSTFINNDIICLWTRKRKLKLFRLAQKYDAIYVIGCEAAIVNVRHIVGDDKIIIKGVEEEGLMTAMPALKFPDKITLEKTNLLKVKFV